MAHTCPSCCLGGHRKIVAPTSDGRLETLKRRQRPNGNYRHENASWKKSTKARKQYLRHVHH